MKRLRKDRRGVEGLPLQMMVGMALLLLTIPPAVSSFQNFQRQMDEERVREEIRSFIIASEQLTIGGEGGVRVIEMDLDIKGLEYVCIGDTSDSGYHAASVIYKMSGTGEVRFIADDPVVFFASKTNDTLVLAPAKTTLRLTTVEELDFTDDGEPDRHIQVRYYQGVV